MFPAMSHYVASVSLEQALTADMAAPGLLLFGEFGAIESLWKSIGGSAAASSSTLCDRLPGNVPLELFATPLRGQFGQGDPVVFGCAVFSELRVGAVS